MTDSVSLSCAFPGDVADTLRHRMEHTGETLDQAVTAIGDVRKHGDFGLGTFVGLGWILS